MCRGLKFRVKYSKKPTSRLAAFIRYLFPYANEQSSTMVPVCYFFPRRGSAISPKYTPKKGTCFSHWDPGDPHCLLWASALLFQKSTAKWAGCTLVIGWNSKTSDLELCCLSKFVITSPSHFPCQWFWGSAFLVLHVAHPACCTPSLLSRLSLSPSPLSLIRALSPPHHSWFFSPPNHVSTHPTFQDMITFLSLIVQFVLSVLR